MILAAVTMTLIAAQAAPAPDGPELERARRAIGSWVAEPAAREALVAHLRAASAGTVGRLRRFGNTAGIDEALFRNVAASLEAKRRLDQAGPPLPLSASEIERTVIDYEAFKLEAFVTSGVFPKRYFGYFDGKYDTATYERRLRLAVRGAVAAVNAYQEEHRRPVRLTEIEVAVTFLAEGGALYLRERQDLLERLHPVLDVGLDDVASGFSQLPGLEEKVDAAVGTHLGELVGWVPGGKPIPEPVEIPADRIWLKHGNGKAGPFPYLRRYLTFEEAIAGTALMYLWEKEIADKKLREAGERPISARPLDEQFVIASLVYNSGILHTPERWKTIRDFSGADWLCRISKANAQRRQPLPVRSPAASLELLRTGGDYPDQPTEWLAVYHVLQRYGAFTALRRFTDVFREDGAFAELPQR